MNIFSGISFYDSLNKLAIGYLIVWWVPFVIPSGVPEFPVPLLLIISYCMGCTWQLLVERFTNMFCRNNINDIEKSLRSLYDELNINSNVSNIDQEEYRNRYHTVMTKGYAGNIPTLEALERFCRSMIPLTFFYLIVSLILLFCPCMDVIINQWFVAEFRVLPFLFSCIFLLTFCLARGKVQSQIYKLVLEEYYFISKAKAVHP